MTLPADDAISTETYGNVTITTHYDDSPSSPREWDNLTTIRGWHRHYTIGDGPDIHPDDHDSWDAMIDSLIESEDSPILMLAPLYWYEHSGSSCKMGAPVNLNATTHEYDADDLARFRSACMDSAGWDSGVAGIVYVTEKSRANLGTPLELVEEVARSEVESYDDYVRGACYGYVVSLLSTCDHGDTHADTLDSCWGFLGDDDYAMQEGRAFVGSYVIAALMGCR
jgi:hypothetical protein